MARMPFPSVPEPPRCPCCRAPVDADGKFSGWPWPVKPGFVSPIIGNIVDPVAVDPEVAE